MRISIFTKALTLVLIFAGVFALQTDSNAQVSISGGVDVVSKYVWRGYNLADGFSVQPTLDITLGSFGFNIWASRAMADRDTYSASDELDFTFTYSPMLSDQLGVTLGFIYYTFPTQDDFDVDAHTSKEVFATLAPAGLPLSPELTVYYDFDLGDDLYASLGVGHSIPLNGHSLDLGVALGYNNGQFGAKSNISNIDFSVSTGLALGAVSISPRVVYVVVPESSVNTDNEFYFGVSISR